MNGLKIPLPEWLDQAACANFNDPDLFYTPGREASAMSICRMCPVAPQCLNHARARGERHGIWGGRDFNRQRPGCKQGHSASHIYTQPGGRQVCLACKRRSDAAYKQRQRDRQKAEKEAAS